MLSFVGANDPSYLLEKLEVLISKVKEEAFSRRDMTGLEKAAEWLDVCRR